MRIKKTRVLGLIFFVLGYFDAFAQNRQLLDSLERQLKNTVEDSSKISIYNALSWEWSEYDASKAITYSRKAIDLALKAGNDISLMRSYNRIGNAFDYAAEYDSAYYYYNKGLVISRELKLLEDEAILLNNLGGSFFAQGKFEKALEYFIPASKAREKAGDVVGYANTLNNIGVIYRNTGDYGNAVYAYKKAIKVIAKLNDLKGMYRCCVNLTVAYHELDNLDSAFAYADKAMKYAKQIGEPSYIASVLAAKAPLYQDIKQYDKTIALLKEALKLTEKIDNANERVRILAMLATAYAKNQDYPNALKTHQEAMAIAKELDDNVVILRTLSGIADVYAHQGNYKLAYDYKKQYEILNDSVALYNNTKDIAEMKARFETELKDKEIAQTKAEQALTQAELEKEVVIKRWFLGMLIVVFGVACTLFYFFRQRSIANKKIEEQRQKIELALSEKEALLREIHHRVKNNLQIISGLLELQEARSENAETKKMVDEAQSRIKSMSITHEMLYQTSDLSAINMEEYVERLADSVALSFAGNFRVEKEIKLKGVFFNIDTIIPIGLILNELMTNSYKYAFRPERENKLSLSIQRKGEKWELIYGDNGNGLPPQITNISNQKSFGLRLINMLVRQLKGKTAYIQNDGAFFIITFQER